MLGLFVVWQNVKNFEYILQVCEIQKSGMSFLPNISLYVGGYLISTYELRTALSFLKDKNRIQQNKTNLSQKPFMEFNVD